AIGSYFAKDTQFISLLGLKVVSLSLVIIGGIWYYHRHPESYFFGMVLLLLLFRLGVDLFALPARARYSSLNSRRVSVREFAHRRQDQPLAVFHNTSMEMASSFYLQNELQRVVPRRPLRDLSLDELYIFNPAEYDSTLFLPLVDSFVARHNQQGYFYVGQLRSLDSVTIESCWKGVILGY
ncbi:MAG: hypothetical protein D6772_02895, partial [Bacteroidetes bacterium]